MMKLKRISIESFLVVILMITLAISMSIMILQGSHSFDRMLQKKNQTENFRIAISYVNMIIKQNDSNSNIFLEKNFANDNNALVIKHQAEESGLFTYIYSVDGTLYEQYGEQSDTYDLDLSSEIITCDVNFIQENNKIKALYQNENGKEYQQIIALRSKVNQ